jgi:hypothetical protein
MATTLKKRNIQYISKDFSTLRQSLINYSRTYFPTTYTDFTPASPGMLFMEQAAYIGDVLSFYLDNQIQENFLQYARQPNNLYELAYMFGYKPNVTQVATVDIDIYQQLPVKGSSPNIEPDFDYALSIAENTTLTSTLNNSIDFLIEEPIDFSVSSSTDPTEITVLTVSSGNPTAFLLKKTRKAISSTIKTTTFSFGAPTQFPTFNINDENIVGILDITDNSTGEQYYEVPYLGQEMVFDSIKNTNVNDPNFSEYNDAPYLLKLKQQQRRFVTRFISTGSLEVQFGAGTAADNDEEIIPNPNNVGIGLPFEKDKLTTAFSPSNFLFTKTYGVVPNNTTLTVRYLTGGGVDSNVPSNSLTNFNADINFLNNNLDPVAATTVFDSVRMSNINAADGGGDGDTLQEIRENASANFGAQLRNVTQDDYLVRALSMPSKYGVISKAFIEPTKIQNISAGESNSILDLYVLSYNVNNQLSLCSEALKQNLSTYLSIYRMVNDSINIKNGFIINIGVNFDIIVLPEFNNNQVLQRCILALQNYFDIDNWSINQPIILRDIFVLLDRIEGVQTVKDIKITNKVGENLGYSQYSYDISAATNANVIYPSLDPSIFEVKFPSTDIQGRVVPL